MGGVVECECENRAASELRLRLVLRRRDCLDEVRLIVEEGFGGLESSRWRFRRGGDSGTGSVVAAPTAEGGPLSSSLETSSEITSLMYAEH